MRYPRVALVLLATAASALHFAPSSVLTRRSAPPMMSFMDQFKKSIAEKFDNLAYSVYDDEEPIEYKQPRKQSYERAYAYQQSKSYATEPDEEDPRPVRSVAAALDEQPQQPVVTSKRLFWFPWRGRDNSTALVSLEAQRLETDVTTAAGLIIAILTAGEGIVQFNLVERAELLVALTAVAATVADEDDGLAGQLLRVLGLAGTGASNAAEVAAKWGANNEVGWKGRAVLELALEQVMRNDTRAAITEASVGVTGRVVPTPVTVPVPTPPTPSPSPLPPMPPAVRLPAPPQPRPPPPPPVTPPRLPPPPPPPPPPPLEELVTVKPPSQPSAPDKKRVVAFAAAVTASVTAASAGALVAARGACIGALRDAKRALVDTARVAASVRVRVQMVEDV